MPGKLADNIVHFARVLRAAGLPVGPDRIIVAQQALQVAGVGQRPRVHAALSAALIDRHEHQPVFDAAFSAFWQDPKLLTPFFQPTGGAGGAVRTKAAFVALVKPLVQAVLQHHLP